MQKLEVILKMAEVCNIACSYCYYFFSGDARHATRPIHLQQSTIDGLCRFINNAHHEGRFGTVQIDFHGGEPLMIGKHNFDAACEQLRRQIECNLSFCVTTNATLIDDEWIALFSKWDVSTCVSIDGPEHIHDKRRVDKRGRGTHGKVIEGYRQLYAAASCGKIQTPAVLCVVDPDENPADTYNYLVHDLGVRTLDFLMPDKTWDSGPVEAKRVAEYMKCLMACWLDDDNPEIHVRTLKSVLSLMISGQSYLAGFGSAPSLVMTVGSEGTIDTDDFLKPCGADIIETTKNIKTAAFDDVFNSAKATAVTKEITTIPDECMDCAFAGVCRGGQATHRFGRGRRFNNPSVYCEAQRGMFAIGAAHLLRSGVLPAELAQSCSAGTRLSAVQ